LHNEDVRGLDMAKRDLVEIFGYAAGDVTNTARTLWNLQACPFINKACIKFNHDQSIVYGTCSVTSPYGDTIICPNRLYANGYAAIWDVARDAFGDEYQHLTFEQYIEQRGDVDRCIVALGKNSGKEVQIGRSLSMDWVLAKIENGSLTEYVGIEVQSIDITGNYRDAWHAYNNLSNNPQQVMSSSGHGLNWANVHKRLIPQLIRKGVVYSRSNLVNKGLYFIVPEIVYCKFEDVIGNDIPQIDGPNGSSITIFTYALGESVAHGQQRALEKVRTLRFELDELSKRFIAGKSLPSGADLDDTIKCILGVLQEAA